MAYTNNAIDSTSGSQYLVQNSSTVGANTGILMGNSDNTNTASNCIFDIHTTSTGGDPFIDINVIGGGATYCIGIDNSDSDKLKITTGATPSAGTTLFTMTSTGDVTYEGSSISLTKNLIGAPVSIAITNTDTTTGTSSAGLVVITNGAASGDPFVQFNNAAGTQFTMGIDNSAAGHPFKISGSYTLGTADLFIVDFAANITLGNNTTNNLTINNQSAPTAGAIAGYLVVNINGSPQKIPYYAV